MGQPTLDAPRAHGRAARQARQTAQGGASQRGGAPPVSTLASWRRALTRSRPPRLRSWQAGVGDAPTPVRGPQTVPRASVQPTFRALCAWAAPCAPHSGARRSSRGRKSGPRAHISIVSSNSSFKIIPSPSMPRASARSYSPGKIELAMRHFESKRSVRGRANRKTTENDGTHSLSLQLSPKPRVLAPRGRRRLFVGVCAPLMLLLLLLLPEQLLPSLKNSDAEVCLFRLRRRPLACAGLRPSLAMPARRHTDDNFKLLVRREKENHKNRTLTKRCGTPLPPGALQA